MSKVIVMKLKNSYFFTIRENIKDEEAEKALGILQSKIADDADISLINGGQPVYDYIIAAE